MALRELVPGDKMVVATTVVGYDDESRQVVVELASDRDNLIYVDQADAVLPPGRKWPKPGA